MKSGSGSSLAIAERKKPAPSCVAALFQMLAKRKLFSSSSKKSKMLPPVRAQKFSPGRPPAGGETMQAAKTRPLLLNAEYSRSKSEGNGITLLQPPGQDQNCSEMCSPGVVARLMGLNSMPAASHQRPTKDIDSSKLGDHQDVDSLDWHVTSRSIYTSPQKQQKTGQELEVRHGNGGQLGASDTRPLWPQRRAHKVASPIRSPRSMSSRNKARLIEAAAKVLEPGLQSRNRRHTRRHAYLEYSCDSDVGGDSVTVFQNLSSQFSRDMCNVDPPRSGAHNIAATSVHNSTSNQWTEQDSKKTYLVRKSDQRCHVQPEGNGKCLLAISSEKARYADSVQRTSNCNAATNQDLRKTQLRKISRESVSCSPLKQNNLKQNALPIACKVADPGYMVQRHKHRSGEQNLTNTAKDFVSLNKSMNGGTSLRSKRKVIDRSGVVHSSLENKNKSINGHRTSGLHSDSSNKLKPKTARPKGMEEDMVVAKGADLLSEKPVPANPSSARSVLRRQVVSHNVSRCDNKPDITSFTFSSPKKVITSSLPVDNSTRTRSAVLGSPPGTGPKRHYRRDCHNPSQKETVFRKVLRGNLKIAESVSFNRGELERDIPGGKSTSSSLIKKSAVPVIEESTSDESLWQCNSVDSGDSVIYGFRCPQKPVQLPDTGRKCEADAEVSNPSPSISEGSNQRNPASTRQSTYADDDPIFGDPPNTEESAFIGGQPMESNSTPPSGMQNATAHRNSRCADPKFGKCVAQPFEPAVQDSNKMIHTGEVSSTVELLLTNVRSSKRHKAKEPFRAFLLQATESALATLNTSAMQDLSTIKAIEASSLGNLALDFLMELLDTKCTQLCGSGYRSFSRLALVCTEERLGAEVKKEIARCSAMAGMALDVLAVDEVEHAFETGMNPMLEAFQIGAQIEEDLVQELVDEIGVDLFKRL
ncbi:hypothetical protein ACP4OV_021570 [Aristida adscensionis]